MRKAKFRLALMILILVLIFGCKRDEDVMQFERFDIAFLKMIIPSRGTDPDKNLLVGEWSKTGTPYFFKISGVGERICKTYHTYTMKGEVVLKRTYWYLMSYNGAEKLKPQREEGITKVRWFKKGHIEAIVDNTFPSIMDVLAKLDMFTDTPMPLSE